MTDLELNPLVIVQRIAPTNLGMVDEQIFSATVDSDKAIALIAVEPFDGSLCHALNFLMLADLEEHTAASLPDAGLTLVRTIPPGTVLRDRRTTYYVGGVPTLWKATQLLYRSTGQTTEPTVNVTSVIPPLIKLNKTKVLSYQSAYDSLNQSHEPSHSIAGGHELYGLIASVELAVFGQFLADGYTVIVPDIEGQRADFAAGPEYGMNTLDA